MDGRTQLVTMRRGAAAGQARRACALPDNVVGSVRSKPDDLHPAAWTRDAAVSRAKSAIT